MKKIFTICFLILNIHNLFAQNCNLPFGIKNDLTNFTYFDDERKLDVCKGVSVVLTADEILNAKYQWFLDDKLITGATKNVYEAIDVSGKYTIKTSLGSCNYSRTMSITFSNSINYGVQTLNNLELDTLIICPQNDVETFRIFPVNGYSKNAKYQWQRDKTDIDGATDVFYSVNKSGVYSVRVTQGECSTTTPKFVVKASEVNTPRINVSGISIAKDTTMIFCTGMHVELGIDRFFYSDYQVFKDNKLISLKNRELISEAGKYRIEYKTGDCKQTTPNIDIKFGNTLPKFNVQSYDLFICDHKILGLSPETFSFISSNSTVEWRKDGVKQSENSIYNTIPVYDKGVYTALIKNGTCQKESEKFEIKSFSSELIPLRVEGQDKKKVEACNGQSFTLYLYSFYSPNSNQFDLFKDGKIIFSHPNTSYRYKITESGKYHLVFRNSTFCQKYSDTLEVIFKDKISNNLTIDNTQCQNGIFNLSAEKGQGLIYAWKKDGKLLANANNSTLSTKEAGNYSVVINQDYCSVASPEIAVGAKIIANSTTCEGQTLQLSNRTDLFKN